MVQISDYLNLPHLHGLTFPAFFMETQQRIGRLLKKQRIGRDATKFTEFLAYRLPLFHCGGEKTSTPWTKRNASFSVFPSPIPGQVQSTWNSKKNPQHILLVYWQRQRPSRWHLLANTDIETKHRKTSWKKVNSWDKISCSYSSTLILYSLYTKKLSTILPSNNCRCVGRESSC